MSADVWLYLRGRSEVCGLRWGFLLDVAFLISDHFKKERTGAKTSYGDVLYSELGGRKLV